jgi:hypothetical protein
MAAEGSRETGIAAALASVDVAAVLDVEDVDGAAWLVDAVADPVRAASGSPLAFERFAEWRTDLLRVGRQRAFEELDTSRGDSFG